MFAIIVESLQISLSVSRLAHRQILILSWTNNALFLMMPTFMHFAQTMHLSLIFCTSSVKSRAIRAPRKKLLCLFTLAPTLRTIPIQNNRCFKRRPMPITNVTVTSDDLACPETRLMYRAWIADAFAPR